MAPSFQPLPQKKVSEEIPNFSSTAITRNYSPCRVPSPLARARSCACAHLHLHPSAIDPPGGPENVDNVDGQRQEKRQEAPGRLVARNHVERSGLKAVCVCGGGGGGEEGGGMKKNYNRRRWPQRSGVQKACFHPSKGR